MVRDDVFLFVFDDGTTCGGVFTRSLTASADVRWCREALDKGGGTARALVANSGNSNAFTGPKGVLKNNATLTALTEALGVRREDCFLAATGVIGEPLSDPNYVGAFVPDLAAKLAAPVWEKAVWAARCLSGRETRVAASMIGEGSTGSGGWTARAASMLVLPQMPQLEAVKTWRVSRSKSIFSGEETRTSTTLAPWVAEGQRETSKRSAGEAMTPSERRKPAASSRSRPGLRMMTAMERPSTRISRGASTATASGSGSERETWPFCDARERTGRETTGRSGSPFMGAVTVRPEFQMASSGFLGK